MTKATTTVLYPAKSDATFDMSYYSKTHMPLVGSKWAQYGLTSWKILKFGSDSQYMVQATIEWESEDCFQKAVSSESAAEVMGDIPNFTNTQPLIITGQLITTS